MKGRSTYYLRFGIIATAFVAAGIGCSAAGDEGSNGTGGTGQGGTGIGGILLDAGGDGSLTDGEICHTEEADAQNIVLDMLVLCDRSYSMYYNNYWEPTVEALTTFFNDPGSEGIMAGLSFFPAPGTTTECNPSLWNPIQYPPGAPPLAALLAEASALTGPLSLESPDGNTPMYGALQGTLQFAQTLQAASPTHKVILVMASDGVPCCTGDCPSEDISVIAQTIVAPAYDNFGIETYTIAIDTTVVDALNIISAAGGTGETYDVSGPGGIDEFADKMREIRDVALGCEYIIPDNPGGEFDPHMVNVIYCPPPPAECITIPRVDGPGYCGTAHGWYYDDPVNPTKIIMCPATCEMIESTQEGDRIKIAFGCPTETR